MSATVVQGYAIPDLINLNEKKTKVCKLESPGQLPSLQSHIQNVLQQYFFFYAINHEFKIIYC